MPIPSPCVMATTRNLSNPPLQVRGNDPVLASAGLAGCQGPWLPLRYPGADRGMVA